MNDKKQKRMRVYVDVDSHGKVFEFIAGPVANRYPHLLHVYGKRLDKSLIPATLIYDIVSKKKERHE